MSHIENKENLKKIRDYLVKDEVLAKEEICEILNFLISKSSDGKLLTSFSVPNDGIYKVGYLPKHNLIMVPKKKLDKVSFESAKILKDEFEYIDFNRVRKYYEIFALLHEVEHSNQFLIAQGKIPFKYNEVKEGYKNLVDILKGRNYVLPHPITQVRDLIAKICYYIDDTNYILERNATIESCNDVVSLANEFEEFDIAKAFYAIEFVNMAKGYTTDISGNMYETYKKLHILDKFKKIEKEDSILEEERLRFGLSVNENTRKVLFKEIDKFKKV